MTKAQATLVAKKLKEKFGGRSEFEPVDQGRYRFAITSKAFDAMPHLRRQDAIWDVVDQVLPRDVTIDISLILAYSPADLAAAK